MPSGPKKRKATKKKKKKAKASMKSVSSLAARARHGESNGGEQSSPASKDQLNSPRLAGVLAEKSDGDSSGKISSTLGRTELNSPASIGKSNSHDPVVEAEKTESNLSENKSLKIERTENTGKEQESKSKIDKGSSLKKPQDKGSSSKKPQDKSSSSTSSSGSDDHKFRVKKKAIVLEPTPIVESVQLIESLPENTTQNVENLAVKTNFNDGPDKPIDSSLEVITSQVNDNRTIQEKDDLVMGSEMPLEQTVILDENDLKDKSPTISAVVESVLKENGVEKLLSMDDQMAPAKTKDYNRCPFCGRSSDDRVNEPETPESQTSKCSDRQPLLASTPRAVERTSWKSCCGILELFSRSDR